MKKTFVVIGVTLALAVGAAAQDIPRMETFLGYSYVRFNPARDFADAVNASGGSGQFAYNFTRHVSGVIDLGGVHVTESDILHTDTTIANFIAGPRYSWHFSRWRPYAQALFGGVYAASSRPITVIPVGTTTIGGIVVSDPSRPIETRLSFGRAAFAMTAGGGLDFKVGRHVSVRPIQIEYFLTRLPDPIVHDRENQNNLRYSAGVNFTFGAR